MKARRSKEDWQELILRQAESGLSAQQFCRNHDVCPKYFSIRKKNWACVNPLSYPYCHPSVMRLKPLLQH
jgi:hypothetical protein